MNVQALPSDIIYKIVCYALRTQVVEESKFKEGLKFLAVCQGWRCAALPVVYRYAFISSGYDDKVMDDSYNSIHELAENLSTVKIDTNVDLIQSQNCVELVRELDVNVHYKILPLLGHAKIANVLSKAFYVWPNVHTLSMSMFTCTFAGSHKDIEPHTKVISEIANRFTQLFPSIKHLTFQGTNVNPIAQVFYGSIAGAYSNKLKELTSIHPIIVPSELIFTNLKHVDIDFSMVKNYQLPSINPRVLESLKIVDAVDAKYWNSFCAGEQSNVIEFSNLKKLHVGQFKLNMLEDNTHNVYQLNFPCLQELIIGSCTYVMPWNIAAGLPATLNKLVINALYELFTSPESFAFPAVENLTLNINSDIRASREELLVSIKWILANINKYTNVYLSIENNYFNISPFDIICGNITKLFIGGYMTLNALYAYLGRLSRLVEIKCENLIVSQCMRGSVVPDPSQLPDTNEMPLNISTKTVDIRFGIPGKAKLKADVVKCLLLRLPNLTKLTAIEVPKKLIASFIDTYKQNYPHLTNVRLNLNTTNRK